MSFKVKDDRKAWDEMVKRVTQLSKLEVTTGVFTGSFASDQATNAEIAFFNEFGTRHIPSRPFMRTAFDNNVERYARQAVGALRKIYDGKHAFQVLFPMGNRARSDMVKSLTEGSWTPNKRATVEAKLRKSNARTSRRPRKGFAPVRPLIDTGTLRRSIEFVIARKGTFDGD